MKENQDYLLNFFTDEPDLLVEKNREVMKEMFDRMMAYSRNGIHELYQETAGTRYSVQGYLEEVKDEIQESDKIASAGYAAAIADFMQLYLQKKDIKASIQHIRTSYKEEVLRVLKKRGSILHKELASAINVSASGLNAIMKMMDEAEVRLINVDQVSKYKIYSLTPAAYQYLCQKDEEQRQIERTKCKDNPYIIQNDDKPFQKQDKIPYIVTENCGFRNDNIINYVQAIDKKFSRSVKISFKEKLRA